MRELLEQVLAIAKAADSAIMAVYGRAFDVTIKQDRSPLTEADRAAHDVIRQGLQALPQGHPILSEEDVEGFSGVGDDGRYWLVDPLDGTKEFIKRNGEFTVNIALIEHGVPILGVVTAPVTGVAYLAAEGVGAYKVAPDGQRTRLQVAGRPAEGAMWRVLGSRSHHDPALTDWLAALGPYQMHPMGSSLKSCLIAEGQADVYPRFGPTSLWDTAAAHAIVHQAGGRIVTLDGQPLHYATPSQTLNPPFVVWGNRG